MFQDAILTFGQRKRGEAMATPRICISRQHGSTEAPPSNMGRIRRLRRRIAVGGSTVYMSSVVGCKSLQM
jgi:hypothetical protein